MKPVCVIVAGLCVLAIGCGGAPGVAPVAGQPPTTLTRNWMMVGARTPASYPILSAALVVNGTQITGEGNVEIQCSAQSMIGGTVSLSGQIANDGTFQASYATPGTATLGSYQVSVTGGSPSATAPNVWTGTYSLASTTTSPSSGSTCSYSKTGTFSAVPIASVTGTFGGAASVGPIGLGSLGANAAYTLQLTQGAPALVTRGSGTAYLVPVSGVLTVTGSPCFTSATTVTATPSSYIAGDRMTLVFAMNDGTQLVMLATLTDPTAIGLAVTTSVMGGTCGTIVATTTLTRR